MRFQDIWCSIPVVVAVGCLALYGVISLGADLGLWALPY